MSANQAKADSLRNHLEEYDDPPQDVRLENEILYVRRNFLSDLVFRAELSVLRARRDSNPQPSDP